MYGKYIVLFALLFTGWILRKLNVIDDKMDHSVNRLIVYFAYPCLIIHNIGTLEMTGGMLTEFLLAFVISLCFLYLYGAVAFGYSKLCHMPKDISNVAEFAMITPNNAFMGFPIALLFFGEEGLFLMLAHNAAMNMVVFTYGLRLLRRNQVDEHRSALQGVARAFLRLITNPNIIALIIGFLLVGFNIRIPEAVDEYLLYIGDIATPMAMIFIGSSLVKHDFLGIIKEAVTLESSVMKLIILPVITAAVLYFVPIDPLMKCIVVLGICLPTATTCSMLAEQEGQDVGTASKILFLSTVVSIVTVPLAVSGLNFIFM